MKNTLRLISTLAFLILLSCGGEAPKEEKAKVKLKDQKTEKKVDKKSTNTLASATVDLTNKGVGPVSSIDIPDTIDQTMATHGKEVFDKMCTACHRAGKKFIGPAPDGITNLKVETS